MGNFFWWEDFFDGNFFGGIFLPLKHIVMAFSPLSLMKPIAACFDGILYPFDLLGPYRQILMAFCPVLTYKAQIGIF